MSLLERARARNTHVGATLNHPFPAQAKDEQHARLVAALHEAKREQDCSSQRIAALAKELHASREGDRDRAELTKRLECAEALLAEARGRVQTLETVEVELGKALNEVERATAEKEAACEAMAKARDALGGERDRGDEAEAALRAERARALALEAEVAEARSDLANATSEREALNRDRATERDGLLGERAAARNRATHAERRLAAAELRIDVLTKRVEHGPFAKSSCSCVLEGQCDATLVCCIHLDETAKLDHRTFLVERDLV